MSVRKIVVAFGLIVLVISLVVHLLTYQNINVSESNPAVWVLFPLGMLVFIFTVITLYLKIGNRAGLQIFFKNTLALMPKWTWIILITFLAYLVFSTFNTAFFGEGLIVPTEFNGKYTTNNHGKITEYTLQEVEITKLNQLRSLSGFWIWLTLCSTLYLLTAKPNDGEIT